MRRFLKIIRRNKFQVAHMGKVNPSLQRANHIRQIIFQIRPIGTGTERHPIMWIVHHFHHAKYVGLVNDNTRQAKYTPSRIVRMNGHVYVILVTDRHDFLQEIFQIFKQLFVVNVFIHLEQFFHMCHTFRLPARHHGSVRISGKRGKHLLRMNGVHCFLGISQYRGAIRPHPGKFGTSPVKHRHEIIAHQMNIFLPKIRKRFNVVLYVLLPFRHTCFDCVMDIHTLNTRQPKPCGLHLFFHGTDSLPAPHLSRCSVI